MGLLSTENYSFHGTYWIFPETVAVPRPLQVPTPPMWIAARCPETVRFTLEKRLGVMATVQRERVSRLKTQIALVEEMAEEVDCPRPRISF